MKFFSKVVLTLLFATAFNVQTNARVMTRAYLKEIGITREQYNRIILFEENFIDLLRGEYSTEFCNLCKESRSEFYEPVLDCPQVFQNRKLVIAFREVCETYLLEEIKILNMMGQDIELLITKYEEFLMDACFLLEKQKREFILSYQDMDLLSDALVVLSNLLRNICGSDEAFESDLESELRKCEPPSSTVMLTETPDTDLSDEENEYTDYPEDDDSNSGENGFEDAGWSDLERLI